MISEALDEGFAQWILQRFAIVLLINQSQAIVRIDRVANRGFNVIGLESQLLACE